MEFLPDGGQDGCGSGEMMSKRTRRKHAPAFKAKVALAAVKVRRRWPNWLSSLMFTPTRSRRGRPNSWMAPPKSSLEAVVAEGNRALSPGRPHERMSGDNQGETRIASFGNAPELVIVVAASGCSQTVSEGLVCGRPRVGERPIHGGGAHQQQTSLWSGPLGADRVRLPI